MTTTEVVTDLAAVPGLTAEWDRLAVENKRPFSAPAWMLAWWRHAAPATAQLRIVVARDRGELIGVAPFYAVRDRWGIVRYRLLAAEASLRTEPLAGTGREEEVAALVAAALHAARPPADIVALEGVPSSSQWPLLLSRHWPGRWRPWSCRDRTVAAPAVVLRAETHEEWLASRSRNFREQVRRKRRDLEGRGAVFRLVPPGDVEEALGAFARLHHGRWKQRGGSGVLNAEVEQMLSEAGGHLGGDRRLRLWELVVDGKAIASHLFVAAGGEVSYWLGGFDDAWSAQQPSLQLLVAAIRHAREMGEDRMDLGGGGQPYKYRLANSEEQLEWHFIVRRGRRYPRARLAVAAPRWRRRVARHVPPSVKSRLRDWLLRHRTIRSL